MTDCFTTCFHFTSTNGKHLPELALTLLHTDNAVTIIANTTIPLAENCQQIGQIDAALLQ